MKLIFHLARSLTARELHYIEQISFRYNLDKESSLFQKFLDILRQAPECPSDNECAMELYGESPSSRYLTLKSRLRLRLVEAVAICELEQERRVGKESASDVQLLYRMVIWLGIARKLPSSSYIQPALKQILRTAEERNYHWIKVIALYWMKRSGSTEETRSELGLSVQSLLYEHSTSVYINRLLDDYFHRNPGNEDKLGELLSKGKDYFPSDSRFGDPVLGSMQYVFEGISSLYSNDYYSALFHFQSLETYALTRKNTVPQHILPLSRLLLAEAHIRLNERDRARLLLPEVCPKLPAFINNRCYQLSLELSEDKPPVFPRTITPDEENLQQMMCYAATCILSEKYREAFSILNRHYKYDSTLCQWFIHVRILRIMSLIGMKNPGNALREMDALRKHLYKVPHDFSREKKILSVLKLANSQDPNENKLQNTLEQLGKPQGPLSRTALSPEMIPIHNWVRSYLKENLALAV